MTITSTQAGIADLLSKVNIQGAQANVTDLSQEEAKQLLRAMAEDSLTAGGNVKTGYFRVLTDRMGNITEIGRSSVSSKGRDKATGLIKALTQKACGENSAELNALETYLRKSDSKVGSRSLVKLLATRADLREGSARAGLEAQGRASDAAPKHDSALARYTERFRDRFDDDSTGRLRLDPLARLRDISVPKPDFVALHKDVVATWKSAGEATQNDSGENYSAWVKKLNFPANDPFLKDLNRGFATHEPGKVVFHRGPPSDPNVLPVNSFMDEWMTDYGRDAVNNLSRNLTRFLHQGAYSILNSAMGRYAAELQRLDGVSDIIFSESGISASATVESSADKKHVLITVRSDRDPVRWHDLAKNGTLDLVWKSSYCFAVPVEALTSKDFDPSCVEIKSLDWGFMDKA